MFECNNRGLKQYVNFIQSQQKGHWRVASLRCSNALQEAYSQPSQTAKVDLFVRIVNGCKLVTIFAKVSILDVCQCSEYTSV